MGPTGEKAKHILHMVIKSKCKTDQGSGVFFFFFGEDVEVSHLHDATYEHVITLVVDPVLQHHFIHHWDEDLVL